jgi:hypothetical protein
MAIPADCCHSMQAAASSWLKWLCIGILGHSPAGQPLVTVCCHQPFPRGGFAEGAQWRFGSSTRRLFLLVLLDSDSDGVNDTDIDTDSRGRSRSKDAAGHRIIKWKCGGSTCLVTVTVQAGEEQCQKRQSRSQIQPPRRSPQPAWSSVRKGHLHDADYCKAEEPGHWAGEAS